MKPLQCKILAALERVDIGTGEWKPRAWAMLEEFVRRNGDLEPVPFRKAWRSMSYAWDNGHPTKVVRAMKKQVMDEATGLTAIRTRREQDEHAELFKGAE